MRMSTNMSACELAKQIEQLVENFIQGSRMAAAAAVERAFASATPRSKARPPRSAARQIAPKRSLQEMETLAERLYEVVCAKPGEAMVVLAPIVGATPRALQVPATRLK